MTITAKIRILPNAQDQEALQSTMETYRKACNFVSGYIFSHRLLNYRKLHNQLYRKLRADFGLGAQMSQSVLKTVIARYKTILETQKKWIKANFRKPQLDLVWNRDYSLRQDHFSIGTTSGRRKIAIEMKGMEKFFDPAVYTFGTAKVVFKHGCVFLHVPVTFQVADFDEENIAKIVGIDRGINFTIATYDSDGKSGFVSGRETKQKRAQYKKCRQQLQKRKTPSARRRLKAIGQRENRWMQDINHCIAKALVETYPEGTVFVLEDLTGIRSVTEKVRLKDRYTQVSWSFYDLQKKIEYKAMMKGSRVLLVDPAYTSQRCPKCGHTERSNRKKKEHSFCCKECGYRSNDDRIAAMNLYQKGKEILQ